jgi:hypothetical protein
MKLYATTTSERASKGQGGNQYLNIMLTAGNKARALVGQLDMSIENDGTVYVDFTDMDDITTRLVSARHLDNPEAIAKAKGEKQKGECKHIPKCEEQEEGPCKAY